MYKIGWYWSANATIKRKNSVVNQYIIQNNGRYWSVNGGNQKKNRVVNQYGKLVYKLLRVFLKTYSRIIIKDQMTSTQQMVT